MKRSPLITIICLLGLLAGSIHSFAQDKPPVKTDLKPGKPGPREEKVAPAKAKPGAEGTFKVLGSKFALGKLVKGAPYSATAITETTQTLSDGNQIIRKNEATVHRDTEGRTRIDQKLETIGKWTTNGEPRLMTLINDPVAGVSYSLDPSTHTAHKNAYAQPKPVPPARTGPFMINGQTVTEAEFEAAKLKKLNAQEEMPLKRRPTPSDPEVKYKLETANADNTNQLRLSVSRGEVDPGRRKTESLGTQVIEGVTAEGTRTTLTIPAGEIGNTLPIEIVDENWYSPELQLQVMTKHHDPRTGIVLYRLTNLTRSEPDRSLFEVPPGYTVNETSVNQPKLVRRPQD